MNAFYRIAACMVLAVLANACATSYPPLPEAAGGPYTLGVGDELRLSVYRLDELSNTYAISDTGVISLPLINSVDASGKTVSELETAIERAISARNLVREPSVSVQIVKYSPIYIIGEVQKPGEYTYSPNMTVLTALSTAGGPTFRADKDKVVITRIVDGAAVKGVASMNSLILPGDTIEVKEGWF